ncbi:MAG: 2Fe-2S iron-sulfur cluster binding domain-containing protein [Magnetococcales bacterium]|nr:2Fe-2S iron-sulfur cluster binding domain-containing protein [Magnetococcales bacterium]MBF0583152.1 2Fe-2S iron-sulfur cluster binding domain-containing protein [Magnetococcales bacterium]
MPKVTFLPMDICVEAEVGDTLLETAHAHGIPLEGACEGSLACSTCHVIVAPEWYDRLEALSEDEEDLLDRAFGLTAKSRLGCQIVMTDALDGLRVTVPEYSVNIKVR